MFSTPQCLKVLLFLTQVAPSTEFMGLPTLIHKKVFQILHSHPSGCRKFKALRSCSKGMRAVADDVTDAAHFCTDYPPALEPYLLALHNLTRVTVRKSHGIGFSKGLEMLSRVSPEPRLLHLRLLGGACSRHETKSFCASSFSLQWSYRLRHLNLCNCRCASEAGGTPTSLTFLHYLPALEELVLNNVSPCLIGADLAWCERLTSLDCSKCYMTALDLSPCRATLRILNCSTNVLASIDLSCCTSLRQLEIRRNHLTTLDLAACVALTAIDCSSNKLRHLEASACVLLTKLVCHHNNLPYLSLAACTQLEILECGFNRISTADISACTSLEVLKCGHNELAFLKLPVGGVLTTLDCKRNGLTLLDVSSCVGLLVLECRGNEISSLNLAACSALRVLDCGDNLLCALDLSACPALNMVDCSVNELFTLDLSSALALETLVCARNRLAFLTVSGCTKLARLDCIYNKLCILDVTTCIGLLYLDCSSNFLSRWVRCDDVCSSVPVPTRFLKVHKPGLLQNHHLIVDARFVVRINMSNAVKLWFIWVGLKDNGRDVSEW